MNSSLPNASGTKPGSTNPKNIKNIINNIKGRKIK